MGNVEAFPLCWPAGRLRSKFAESSRFDTSATKAYSLLTGELKRMGATQIIVSSNVPLKGDGTIRLDREPVDAAVAVYFTRDKKQMVFACDKYDLIRDNILAIAKTIEALRGIERWGSSDMMERAFSGFKALTSSTEREWWEVLFGASQRPSLCDKDTIESAYRVQARKVHPDTAGGSHDAMAELNKAREQALRECA